MNSERLLKLAEFLETVPADEFYMYTWCRTEPYKPETVTEGHCGFSGCAIGWAAHAKLFDGFYLRRKRSGSVSPGLLMPIFQRKQNWNAVSTLFDLPLGKDAATPSKQAEHIFDDDSYEQTFVGPNDVASRIRAFVKGGGKIP